MFRNVIGLLAALVIASCTGDSPSDPGSGPGPVQAPDFTLATGAASLTVAPGAVVELPVTVVRAGGFSAAIALSVLGLPDGVAPVGPVPPVPAGAAQVSIPIGVQPGATTGSTRATVRGSAMGIGERTAEWTLQVSGSEVGYAFEVPSDTVEVAVGDSVSIEVPLRRLGAYAGPVTVRAEGPEGLRLVPDSVSVAEAVFSLRLVAAHVPLGIHEVRLRGAAGGLVERSTSFPVVVVDAPPPVEVAPRPTRLAAGAEHACAVRHDGGILCWGSNGAGQLGTAGLWAETQGVHRTPVPVQAEVPFTQVAAGREHTCALDQAGAAWCWGANDRGQLGDGSFTRSDRPVAVSGGRTWVKLAAGLDHTCGLDAEGSVACWGHGANGQLGDGTASTTATPVAVVEGVRFAEITAGGFTSCGLDARGGAHCWGDLPWNAASSTVRSALPVAMPGAVPFTTVAVGLEHVCGLDGAGGAHCAGRNGLGQLGDSTLTAAGTPRRVVGGRAYRSIAAGAYHTCAVGGDGVTDCWGRNVRGELGDGMAGGVRSVPAAVEGGHRFEEVALTFGAAPVIPGSGGGGTCARAEEGALYCWGANGSGELGTASTEWTTAPAPVARHEPVDVWEAGLYHSCLIDAEGETRCSGTGADGQLGDGRRASGSRPVTVAGAHAFRQISGGRTTTCAVHADGSAWCWGGGALGSGVPASDVPVRVAGGEAWTQVSVSRASGSHACGVTTEGRVRCWGENGFGQLGDSSRVDRAEPVDVRVQGRFVQVVSGNRSTCALREDGQAFCWGYNQYGAVGDGTTLHRTTPAPVAGGLTFTQLSMRDRHVCALDTDGGAWCWGKGDLGELGTGAVAHSSVPAPVAGGRSFVQLATGGGEISANARGHTCALDPEGRVWCWGPNARGQLGDGTTTSRPAPMAVVGGPRFVSVTAGGFFTCARDTEGRPWCWGDGGQGQFGAPHLFHVLTPKPVFHR